MRVKALGSGFALVEGDHVQDYNVCLRLDSCDCRAGTMRLSHPERKECKHLRLAKSAALVRL